MDVLCAFAVAVLCACVGWFGPRDIPRLSTATSFALTNFNVNCDAAHLDFLPPSCKVPDAAPLVRPVFFADSAEGSLQHTLGHIACPACDQEQTQAMMPDALALLPFEQAAQKWLRDHAQYIETRTHHDYKQYIKALNVHFALLPLKDIHIGHIRAYQRSRKLRAGASRINMEMSTLQQILKNANLWYRIAPVYKPMPTAKEGSGKPYTREMKKALIEAGFKRNRWTLAAHCLRVMLNTTCGFGEVRRLRRADFDVNARTIFVLIGAKNPDRRRRIPLNDEAFSSMVWILERFEEAGGKHEDQFLLYHRAARLGSPPDFYRPMGSIRKAFHGMRKAANIPEGYRIYDCRPTAISEMLASGTTNVETVKKISGQVSDNMIRRYYKPQMDILRGAVASLTEQPPEEEVRKPAQKSKQVVLGWSSTTFFG